MDSEFVKVDVDGIRRSVDRVQQALRDRELAEAVKANEPGKVRALLAQGLSPTAKTKNPDYSPPKEFRHVSLLEYACRKNYWDIAEILVDAGASPNQLFPQKNTTPLGLMAEGWEMPPERMKAFHSLVEKGADIHVDFGPQAQHRNLLFGFGRISGANDVVKFLLKAGVDTALTNKEGLNAEEFSREKKWFGHQKPMDEVFRLHRLAPMPDLAGETSRAALEKNNGQGYCALDHWETWDNYELAQEKLAQNGENLRARDLLEPVPGTAGEGQEPRTRLEALLEASPNLEEKLFDRQLWKDESPEVARAFFDKLPPKIRETAPYHSIVAAIRRDLINKKNEVRKDGGYSR